MKSLWAYCFLHFPLWLLAAAQDCYYKPLQVLILQDLTDGMDNVRRSMSNSDMRNIYTMLEALRVDTEVGIMSFRDKPIWPLGNAGTKENSYRDYCTRAEVPFTNNLTQLAEWYANAGATGGGDAKGIQFYALYRAIRSYDFNWKPNADKLLLLITDSPPHYANDGSTEGMNLAPFSGNFTSVDQTDCATEDYPAAEQVSYVLREADAISAYLVIDRDRALDVWNWFNAQLDQPPVMVQSISYWGEDISERFMPMLPQIAHSLSCPTTSTPIPQTVMTSPQAITMPSAASLTPPLALTSGADISTAPQLVSSPTLPPIPSLPTLPPLPTLPSDMTLPSLPTLPPLPTLPSDMTLPSIPTLPPPTLPPPPTLSSDMSLPTLPTVPSLSTLSPVTGLSLPSLPTGSATLPSLPTVPSLLSTPIVEYPTLPPLLANTGEMYTAELVGLPPIPQVPGIGVESRSAVTKKSSPSVDSEKAFLARQTSSVSTTTVPPVIRNCRQITVNLEDGSGAAETLEECSLAEPFQMDSLQRSSFYECLVTAVPGTTRSGASRVLVPSSPTYRLASIPYNLARPIQEPIAIIFVNSTEQAASAVKCASKHSVQLVPRSGGHDYSSFSFGTDRSAIIDVSEIDHLMVDSATGTAEIGPGVRLGKVWYDIYNNGNWMLPMGACTTLGLGGHVLGGGYGFFSRAYGVVSDYMLEAQVVLADGSIVTARYSPVNEEQNDDSNHGELFWALRGAGNGHFGVVTSFKFQLVPAPVNYTSASLLWLGPYHREVIQAVVAWADSAPAGLGLSLAAVANRTGLQVSYPGTIEQFWTAINPLIQRINATVLPFVRQGNWLESAAELSIMNIYDVDTPVAAPVVMKVPTLEWLNTGPLTPVRSRFLCHSGFFALDNKLNATGADIFDRILQEAPSEYGYTLELMGGQDSRFNQPVDSSWPHRQMQFIYHIYIRALEPYDPELKYAYLTDVYYHKLRPISSPNVYANYHDYTLPDWLEHYYVQNLPRLKTIKARYDPNFVFWFPQVITPS